MIKQHRLMAYTFLNLDIDNPKLEVDHIDGNRINNHINNLRVVNRQQNQWNSKILLLITTNSYGLLRITMDS